MNAEPLSLGALEPALRETCDEYLVDYRGELRKKLLYARERGAVGLIVVSGPSSQVNQQLVPLYNDFSPSGSSIAAISITDDMANKLLADHELGKLQKSFDDGSQ